MSAHAAPFADFANTTNCCKGPGTVIVGRFPPVDEGDEPIDQPHQNYDVPISILIGGS